jgi:hypothetical protein
MDRLDIRCRDLPLQHQPQDDGDARGNITLPECPAPHCPAIRLEQPGRPELREPEAAKSGAKLLRGHWWLWKMPRRVFTEAFGSSIRTALALL